MKKILAVLFCLLICVQSLGIGSMSAIANEAQVLFTDSFDYVDFGSSELYDKSGVWEKEYAMPKDSNDFGSVESSAPMAKNGVLNFAEGDGIRFNWQKLSGFSSFDKSKTYTVTFDFKVLDFGDDAPRGQYSTWNRELYFAVAGYYNQIECRSGNYSGQIGIRAGDKTAALPLGGWTNDKSTYVLNKVYNCTFEWKPSEKTVISTVACDGKVIAKGSRTDEVYATVNKHTRFLVWRCEDGAIEIDNVTFGDGTNKYVQKFDFGTEEETMTAGGVWGLEEVRKTDAKAPEFKNGAVVLKEQSSIRFNWQKVKGVGAYDQTKTYIFDFDLKFTDKGDGSNWGGEVHTRGIYIAFGGWYNLIEMPTQENEVKLGNGVEAFSDSKYLNKKMRASVIWQGTTVSIKLCDSNGKVLIEGERTSNAFTDMAAERAAMTNLVFRCEDGAFELDNFKFSVLTVEADSTTEINIAKGKQAVYTSEIDYSGNGKVMLKYGGAELFCIGNDSLRVAGKTVLGSYGKGSYKIESVISPDQEMHTVKVIGPNGEVVSRGFYTLLGGDAMKYFVTGTSKVKKADVKYEAVSLNKYTLNNKEPAYSGVNANIYNVVTSFNDAQTTRNFAWTAKTAFLGGKAMALKYRKAGDSDWITVAAVKENESVNTADEDYFKCDISGLKADTEYEYKIGKKDSDKDTEWTEIFKFKTAKKDVGEFTFVAVGDTQGITWNGLTSGDKGFMFAMAAIEEAFEEVENPAFMLHTGDVVENGNNKNMWNMYFKALNGYGTSTPMFAAIGNHDAWGAPLYFDLHFNHPDNGGTAALDRSYLSSVTDGNIRRLFDNADETIYSYDYGDVHFIVLNTGSYCAQDKYIIEAQRQWLIKDLEANKDAKWTVMTFHEPVYHRLGGGEARPWLYDVIEKYGVDLVIQGHSHLVTRTYPMKDGKIVTKAVDGTIEKGIGTVYTTIGSTALNHDGANDAKYEEEISILATPTPTQPAYTTITVKDDRIVVTTKQVNGYVLDSYTIVDKGNSGNTPGDPSGDQSTETPDNSEDASEDISEDISEEISDGVSVDASTDASEAVSKEDFDVSEDESKTDVSESASEGSDSDEEEESGSATAIITVSVIAAVIVAAVVLILIKRKKK